jgi:hypothetical protein
MLVISNSVITGEFMKNVRWIGLLISSTLMSACVPTNTRQADLSTWFKGNYGQNLTAVITKFEPGRGTGATYKRNSLDRLRLNLTTNRDGYITIVSIDEKMRFGLLDQFYFHAGDQVLPPAGTEWKIQSSNGLRRLRAIFTDTPPAAKFPNSKFNDDIDQVTVTYLNRSNANIRDVAETYFILQ